MQKQKSTGRFLSRFGSIVLVITSVLLLAALLLVRWLDTRILNTDNWVATVSSLPKDPVVSTALGTYMVSNIISPADATAKIKDALPPKAGFLAAPIYDQLHTRVTRLTTKFISSDQFQGIWTSANQLAVSRLLDSARAGPTTERTGQPTKLQVGLQDLRQKLVSSQKLDTVADRRRTAGITVDFKTKKENFGTFVRLADSLNKVLPFVTLAALTGGIALAVRRARAAYIFLASSAVMCLAVLIATKLLTSSVVGQVRHAEYKSAVAIIMTQLTSNLKNMTINLLIACIVGIAIGVALHYALPRLRLRFPNFQKTSFSHALTTIRPAVKKYSLYILGSVVVVILAVLSFSSSEVTPAILINSAALIVITTSVLAILRRPNTVHEV
jgi:hypothetical protein